MGGGEFGAETLLVLDEMRFLDPEHVCLASLIIPGWTLICGCSLHQLSICRRSLYMVVAKGQGNNRHIRDDNENYDRSCIMHQAGSTPPS